jgi:hypothetical protein
MRKVCSKIKAGMLEVCFEQETNYIYLILCILQKPGVFVTESTI